MQIDDISMQLYSRLVNLKELKLVDKTLIFQMISARDKVTGKYLLMQDGNVNSMLHRIYNNLGHAKRIYMTLPPKQMIDSQQLLQFMQINEMYLESSIVILHDDMYGSNVALTRQQVSYQQMDRIAEMVSPELIVSEFPIFMHNWRDVKYNFNCNKVSDDDTNPWAASFEEECKIAKYYEVYLFSDEQYYYMHKFCFKNEKIFRSSNIYNESFMRSIQKYFLQRYYDESINTKLKSICETGGNLIYFPSRVDDPRYKFDDVVKLSNNTGDTLIVANYMNVDISKYTSGNLENVVDLATIVPPNHSRYAYFRMLGLLTSNDRIYRAETDMHISLIEQSMITAAQMIHSFHPTIIQSYINNARKLT